MQSSELIEGETYAWSESPRSVRLYLSKVRYIGPARAGKAKVRREGGDLEGLEEWVATRQLLCSWAEREPCLRDRRKRAELEQEYDDLADEVVEMALSHVLEATGEESGFLRTWSLDPDKAERLWQRAGLKDDPRDEPLAFGDRHGQLHLGYASALRFAKAFAANEPEPCLHLIGEWENALRAEGYLPGQTWQHGYLHDQRPSYALVRQWAGAAEIELLRTEIGRLQRLVTEAAAQLRAAGMDDQASSLIRGLHGR